MPTVEERLERIEKILEGSGLALLGEMRVGPLLEDNLAHLAEPKNLRLLSILDRYVEQADALEKLAETLEKLDESGVLELAGEVFETLVDNLGQLMEPRNLRLISHLGKLTDVLALVDPNAAGMMTELFIESLTEVFPKEKLRNPPRVGLAGLLRALSDPEIQKGLGVVLELLRVVARTFDKAKAKEDELMAMMEKMMKKR